MKYSQFDELFETLLKIENIEESRKFFEDLCTVKELESMLQRVKAAKMLLENKTFVEIQKETKISSATLARVSKCIKYGDGGYKNILTKKDEDK